MNNTTPKTKPMTQIKSNSINSFIPLDPALVAALQRNVGAALEEDIGAADLTGKLVPALQRVQASVVVREQAVLCGSPWFDAVMEALDPSIVLDWQYAEGDLMTADSVVCHIDGLAVKLLTAERSALNFLQLLSAVATATRKYVNLVAGTSATILDTRKTLPGLRLAQKYAVRVGGGQNQRLALYDGILIKENHIAAAGGIALSLQAAKSLDADNPTLLDRHYWLGWTVLVTLVLVPTALVSVATARRQTPTTQTPGGDDGEGDGGR